MFNALGGRKQSNALIFAVMIFIVVVMVFFTHSDEAIEFAKYGLGAIGAVLVGTNLSIAVEDGNKFKTALKHGVLGVEGEQEE